MPAPHRAWARRLTFDLCPITGFCGIVAAPNNILHFILTITDGIGGGKEVDNNNNMPEEAMKAVLVRYGTEMCTVGFLSESIVAVGKDKARYIGRFAQMIRLYDHLTNKTMSLKRKKNMGIASFRHLEDIQEQE